MTSSVADPVSLFNGAASLLRATLDGHQPESADRWHELPGGARARYLDVGVLEIAVDSAWSPVVLSAGVHGNETAPVEILDQIASDIIQGTLIPARSLLIILANPEALRAGARFIDINMNRLFVEDAASAVETSEHERARRLMAHVREFIAKCDAGAVHLDLHTTIRGSRVRRFAMCADGEDSPERAQAFSQLGQWGISAVVLSLKTRTTFAAWSFLNFGARSFTLELGRALPFGENDLSQFAAFEEGIRQHIAGAESDTDNASSPPMVFEVNREIMRESEAFELSFPDDVENFTALEAGQLVAVDGSVHHHAEQEERLLFPNAGVAIGQRALVLITPVAPRR